MAAAGLEPDTHLGMTIAEVAPTLFALDKKFGSHVCGEGGEYETFVTDCPLFKAKIVLEETRTCAGPRGSPRRPASLGASRLPPELLRVLRLRLPKLTPTHHRPPPGRSIPHPSGDSSVAFLHLDAFHIEPKAGVPASAAMTAVVEEVHDPTDPAPAAPAAEPAPSAPGKVAVTRGDAMWTFQFRPAAGCGARGVRALSFSLDPSPPQERLAAFATVCCDKRGNFRSQAARTWSSSSARSTPSRRRCRPPASPGPTR